MMYKFKKLIVWQKAMELTVSIHRLTQLFPEKDNSGLSIQINQAATLVPVLIAQGSRCQNRKELCQYLDKAETALYELLTLVYVAAKLEYFSRDCLRKLEANISNISQLLGSLIKYITRINE